MKFNKTILAVAIAGIAAAPVAQADVTLSGYIGIILGSDDSDDAELAFSSDDSTLNVAATHELNSGLTGYGHWRVDGGLSNGGSIDADNIHVGVKGGFGDIRVGEVPDALEFGQVAGDILFDIGGEERGVSYTGSFGPATIGLNWSPVGNENGAKSGGGSDKIAAGIKFSAGGFAIGVGAGDVNEEAGLSAGASFTVAGFSVGVAFKSLEQQVQTAAVEAVPADGATPAVPAVAAVLADRETISASLGYGIGNVSAKLTFEAEQGDFNEDDTKMRFDLGYGLGGGMDISTRINVFTDELTTAQKAAGATAADLTDYRVMLTKSF